MSRAGLIRGAVIGFTVPLLLGLLLLLLTIVIAQASVGEAIVAVGTLALALATAWLALEARAERAELRQQYDRSTRAVRDAEQRRWALELRRVLLEIEDVTLEYALSAERAAEAYESSSPGAYATARVEARQPWIERLEAMQLDLQDRIDTVDLIDRDTRWAFVQSYAHVATETAAARTSAEVAAALEAFLEELGALVHAINTRLDLPTIRRVDRSAGAVAT